MSRLEFIALALLTLVAGHAAQVSAAQKFELWQDAFGELLVVNVGNPDADNPKSKVVALEFTTPPSINLHLENYRTLAHLTGGYFTILEANDHFLSETSSTNQYLLDSDEKMDFIRVGRLIDLADGDRDNDADLNDFGLLKDNFGKPGVADFNGDATTDLTDFGLLRSQYGVSFDQLLTVKVLLGEPAGPFPTLTYPATFGKPDWIAAGLLDPPDGVLPTGSSAIPEPSSIVLGLAAVACWTMSVGTRRWRR